MHFTFPLLLLLACVATSTAEYYQIDAFEYLLLALGGQPSSAFNRVELVDLSGSTPNCPTNIADYTAAQYGTVMVSLPQQQQNLSLLVCGGWSGTTNINRCNIYNESDDSWVYAGFAMGDERRGAAAVLLSDMDWWVTGGINNSDSTLMSTELFKVEYNNFTTAVDLPVESAYHNLIKIDDTHVMLLGGNLPTAKAWMLDTASMTWSELPDLHVATSKSQAGLVTHADGRKDVVVVAGTTTNVTQIFSVDDMMWRLGADFPLGFLYYGSSVGLGDTFMVVGGYSSGVGYQDAVMVFEPDTEAWLEVAKLEVPRDRFAAVLVPFDLLDCDYF